MKRWAWIVAGLYALTLAILTVPALLLAFVPKMGLDTRALEVFRVWPYWIWLGVMFSGQFALLAVPVRVASRRPLSQRSLWPTILAGGLMLGGLVVSACFSVYEFIFRDKAMDAWPCWTALGLGLFAWSICALIFFRMGRCLNPSDLVSRQCRLLLKGSVLELLIAVPTHIVARYRDYCCAGFMTFVGLTMGVAVMLFSFGPAVFFLYVDRWNRLHPRTGYGSANRPGFSIQPNQPQP